MMDISDISGLNRISLITWYLVAFYRLRGEQQHNNIDMIKILNNLPRHLGKNKTHFSTTTNRSVDKEFYYERNKKYTENSQGIEVRYGSPANKSLTSDQLLGWLEHTKQDVNDNINSAQKLEAEADH